MDIYDVYKNAYLCIILLLFVKYKYETFMVFFKTLTGLDDAQI